MVALREDLRLALDCVAFARELGIVPDGWQEDLLRSSGGRVLLNCSRQSGKSTMSAVIALHRALPSRISRIVPRPSSQAVTGTLRQDRRLL
jgi:hypothetical protein